MTQDINVRPASVDEIVALRVTVLGWKRSTIGLDTHPSAKHFAAELESGAVVGCASAGLSDFPLEQYDLGRTIRFWGVAVLHPYQGKGIGTKLVYRFLQHGRELRAAHAWANARESAVPFYLKHGFEEVGERFTDVLSGLSDSRVLIKL